MSNQRYTGFISQGTNLTDLESRTLDELIDGIDKRDQHTAALAGHVVEYLTGHFQKKTDGRYHPGRLALQIIDEEWCNPVSLNPITVSINAQGSVAIHLDGPWTFFTTHENLIALMRQYPNVQLVDYQAHLVE